MFQFKALGDCQSSEGDSKAEKSCKIADVLMNRLEDKVFGSLNGNEKGSSCYHKATDFMMLV
jgi:hypothetical protein